MTEPAPSWPGLAEALGRVRDRIDGAAADPGAVRLVAVTKGFPAAAAAAARAAGVDDLGENYADELVGKAEALSAASRATAGTGDSAPRWHYLGAVQRNKVPRLAPVVTCWQGLRRVAEGEAIARRSPGATVLVQVDVAGLPGRGGCPPHEIPELVGRLRDLDLDVAGLMAVGPPGPPEAARDGFRTVRSLADRLGLRERSMGMTDDLEVAVEEGSTMVRVGRALFGTRPPADGRIPGRRP